MRGGQRGRELHLRRPTVLGLALVTLTLLLPGGLGSPPGSAPPGASATWGAPTSGHCLGGSVPSTYSGTLGVLGGPTPHPSVSNVSLGISYFYEWNDTPRGGASHFYCVPSTVANLTGPSGRVTLSTPVPSTLCDSAGCSSYGGPFGPVTFPPPAGTPGGYFYRGTRIGASVSLDFVSALSSVLLSPYGRTTVSTVAPTPIAAFASAGDGSASPALVSYDWHLTGSGWSVLAGTGTANLTVSAGTGAGPGSVSVWVNGSYNGTGLSVGPASLSLTAVATEISSASVVPTSLDAGASATFTLLGSGSAGYRYAATVFPGLGAPGLSVPCSTTIVPGGILDLSCTGSAPFTSTGTAQPAANLSNGYSTATWSFPSISVAAAIGVVVSPATVQAYVGAPITLTVSVAGNTGTPPFGPACVGTGDGRAYCDDAAGASWTFDLNWSSVGQYPARASVVDSTGANRTVGFLADIVTLPTLDPITASSNAVSPGGSVTLLSRIAGGAYPVRYWWNDSAPVGTIYAGAVERAAPLSLVYTPSSEGNHLVTLTTEDALGGVRSQEVPVTVPNGRAVEVVPYGTPPTPAVPAGTPYSLTVAAVDALGGIATGFPGPSASETLTITIAPSAPAGRLWVNASSGPPLFNGSAGPGGASFVLPASAWARGILNLSVTSSSLGVVTASISGSAPSRSFDASRLSFTVRPDGAHLTLSEPRVAVAGARTNSTLYRVQDRFGNPGTGEFIEVQSVFGPTEVDHESPVRLSGFESFVWVNFTAPNGDPGTIFVLGPDGQSLLPPIRVPGAASTVVPEGWIFLAAAAGVVGVGSYAFLERRRRRFDSGRNSPEVTEEDLRRVAEGRAHVLSRARTDRGTPLDGLAAGFPGRPPTQDELAEWVGALVSEGALRAVIGPDGKPGFVRVPDPPGAMALRVDLDVAALDAALALQPDAEAEREPVDGASGRP